jgi:hypothetical protein
MLDNSERNNVQWIGSGNETSKLIIFDENKWEKIERSKNG